MKKGFFRNPGRLISIQDQQGSTLLYVMILLGVSGTYFYYQMEKPDHYDRYVKREKQVAFTPELAEKSATNLFCPGGMARISRNSCDKSQSIKLSIAQLRNMVYQAQASFQMANGNLPQKSYSADKMHLTVTRIECYRTQTDINPQTTKPYTTPDGTEICLKIKNIDPAVIPFPMAQALRGGDPIRNYDFNLGILMNKVIPEINMLVFNSKMSLDQAKNDYKKIFEEIKAQEALCQAKQAPIDPTCAKLADLEKQKMTALTKLDQIKKMAAHKDKLLILRDFIEDGILNGAPQMLTNIQLAAMQKKGGIWKRVMTEGIQGTYKYILDNIPSIAEAQKIGIGDPPPLSEAFPFQMLTFDPACRPDAKDPKGEEKILIFRGKIGNEIVLQKFPNIQERALVMGGLKRALYGDQILKEGWVDLPRNLVPAKCTLIEEDDPIILN